MNWVFDCAFLVFSCSFSSIPYSLYLLLSQTIIQGTTDEFVDNESDFESVPSDEEAEDDENNNLTFRASQCEKPKFFIEQIFITKKLFKDVVNMHSVDTGRSLLQRMIKEGLMPNVSGMVLIGISMHALKVVGQQSFQIEEYNSNHNCARQYHIENVRSGWLARKYAQDFRAGPHQTVRGFRNKATIKLRCHISHSQAYGAK